MLLRHLPRDSAVARELHGEAAEWSVSDYLLAAAVDQLAESNWMFATVNQDEDAEPLEYPVPVSRPGAEPAAEESGEGPEASPSAGRAGGEEQPDAVQLTRFFAQ
ncbi:hypothetical protein [Streptomyces cyaneofuscatus]|uniref:hypothetical protein n=1 Tax=Streptomyces cyaneofuscatus TaxID=66883 RepID=UPI00365D0B10